MPGRSFGICWRRMRCWWERERETFLEVFQTLHPVGIPTGFNTTCVCVCHTAGSTSEKGKAVGLEYGKKLRGRQPTYGRTGGPCVCGGGGNEMLRTVLCCVISKISDARGWRKVTRPLPPSASDSHGLCYCFDIQTSQHSSAVYFFYYRSEVSFLYIVGQAASSQSHENDTSFGLFIGWIEFWALPEEVDGIIFVFSLLLLCNSIQRGSIWSNEMESRGELWFDDTT